MSRFGTFSAAFARCAWIWRGVGSVTEKLRSMTLILPHLHPAGGPIPDREKKRLEELYSMDVLDTSSDERFNKYTELATRCLDAPIASVILVDQNRLVFKAVHGPVIQDVDRESSFAAHTLEQPELLIVEDALEDRRFATHPLVEGKPHIRSYAGSVIRGPSGHALGALCVMDTMARPFSMKEREILLQLTRILEHEIESRAQAANLRQRIREEVLSDAATQLPTEALFTARLARAIEMNPAKPILLALIRLERFESIHSAVGKPGAAHLVRNAAARLKQALNRKCLIGQAREDTIALAFAVGDVDTPEMEITQILACFTHPFLLGDHTLAQNVSVGTAMHPRDGSDSDTLLKRARTALNAIPPADVSSFRQYHRRLSAEAARQFEIETALRGAIERDELELVYQPKLDIDHGTLVGAEALLRWTTPKLGKVEPGEFIPIAEESGLIVQLGDWALATACQQIAAWEQKGYDCPQIGVNVSSIQLRQQEFCDHVGSALDRHAIRGEKLNLEVTEGTLIENIGDAIRIMSELRKLGISFSIDDFGKGFSSLSYLARMPVQVLKIDRSFIERIPGEHTSMTLVRSIIAMGHALGLEVVAEGVESEEQLNVLRMAACNQAQGYLISRPLDTEAFARSYLAAEARREPKALSGDAHGP
jgi:EAL domain-containing protein (putative c-di-GMP-specific phosphodiesterase class I)/GGDEF domain-containing protein